MVHTNPTPGDRIWIASNDGSCRGREDDFEFEAGKTYVFDVKFENNGDRVDLTVYDDEQYVVRFIDGATGETIARSSLPAAPPRNFPNFPFTRAGSPSVGMLMFHALPKI